MGSWAPGDMHAAWVAIFILFTTWWLTIIPKFFYGHFKDREGGEGGGDASGDVEQAVKVHRAHKAYGRARDGALWLLIAVTIAFAGQANQAATNALAYIFMAIWLVIVIMSYVVDSKKLHTSLEFAAVTLLFALIIMAFASASGRWLVR